MKHTLREVFRSSNFVIGLSIFMLMLLFVIIYPLFVSDNPLRIIAIGTFFEPGVYVSTYDSIFSPQNTLRLEGAAARRVDSKLTQEMRFDMLLWLLDYGIPEDEIDIEDTEQLLNLWTNNYDRSLRFPGMTSARQKYFGRLDTSLDGLLATEGVIIARIEDDVDELVQKGEITQTDYVNIRKVPNVKVLPLGTDNFGRDVLTELVSATATSLKIGFIAGLVATSIGLVSGLMAGYIGGWMDDIIMFGTNLFTVIPGFVLLILISFSIGQEQRGATTVAVVIGLTSWGWTTRAVRAQVISLRHRDHVNLSKLSGHSITYIIAADILPYIASYVVMAFILQVSSGILAEAGLSILGLGPKTTEVPTLGLMMNWAMIYQAHIMGKWWAYFPVIVVIALIAFSLNLMNTGLDQVFNPTLRN